MKDWKKPLGFSAMILGLLSISWQIYLLPLLNSAWLGFLNPPNYMSTPAGIWALVLSLAVIITGMVLVLYKSPAD